jgi:hypothetical protein
MEPEKIEQVACSGDLAPLSIELLNATNRKRDRLGLGIDLGTSVAAKRGGLAGFGV